MANKKTNRFEQKASKQKIMSQLMANLNTKNNIKNSMIETGKDVLIGVVAGGFAGAAIGKPSLLIGIVASGVGHYIDNRLLSTLGLGMMVSNAITPKTVQGFETDGLDGVKERMIAYKENLLERTYLNNLKMLSAKKSTPTISGTSMGENEIGDVQYFSYPTNGIDGANEDLTLLNHIENQIANSGMQGMDNEMGATQEMIFEDAIY